MSKSGVFAHFGSREELQISVIRDYHVKFEEEVFLPAIREARGLPRLRALFERWVRRVSFEIDSGCIYISGAVEFDDRPGPGARRAGHDGADLAGRAHARHPAGHRRRPPARRDLARAADVRDPRPDPRAAPRRALPAQPRQRRPRARWASSACSRIRSPRRPAAAPRRRLVPIERGAPAAPLIVFLPLSSRPVPGAPTCPSTTRRCATCSSCCTKC